MRPEQIVAIPGPGYLVAVHVQLGIQYPAFVDVCLGEFLRLLFPGHPVECPIFRPGYYLNRGLHIRWGYLPYRGQNSCSRWNTPPGGF